MSKSMFSDVLAHLYEYNIDCYAMYFSMFYSPLQRTCNLDIRILIEMLLTSNKPKKNTLLSLSGK